MRAALGISGASCLFSGVFLPVCSLPLATDLDYFQHGHGDGAWVGFIALIALLLVVLRLYKALWLPILAISVVMGHSLYRLWERKQQLQALSNMNGQNAEVLSVSPMLAEAVQLEWGALVLLIGLVLLIWVALWPHKQLTVDAVTQ